MAEMCLDKHWMIAQKCRLILLVSHPNQKEMRRHYPSGKSAFYNY